MRLKLQEALDERGLTAYQLAKAIGISQPSVHAWLKGRTRKGERIRVYPDYDSLDRICRFLEVTPNDLLELETPIPERT